MYFKDLELDKYQYTMSLKINWVDFVEANKKVLKEKATIQVWSFRKDEQLCFAVVCVDEPVINRMTLEEASSAGGSLLIS
ncbi:hypothetical protein Tco_0242238 [Tanacetum coccineum]